MRFEKLILLKEELLEVYKSMSLEDSIRSKARLLDTIDQAESFDRSAIVAILDQMLEYNQTLISELAQAIDQISSEITADGLALSNNPEYTARFSDKNTNKVTEFNYGLAYTPEIETSIKNRMIAYASWQYPALYLHCCNSVSRIDYITASDPLYLVNQNLDEILEWIKKYPEQYQNRLRLYQVESSNFAKLPQQQFGFVFCWEFFNQLTLEQIQLYLVGIFDLLRPGGTVMFSYNNSEKSCTAKSIDSGFFPWASRSYIEQLLVDIGYTNLRFNDKVIGVDESCVSWAEASRPGELTTIKQSQPLGKIEHK